MANKKPTGTEDVQVIKKKPRGGNSPVIGDNGLMVNVSSTEFGADESPDYRLA